MVGAALGLNALGLPLLHPRGGPVPPTGSETSIVDTATTDTLVDSSTTLVDSSSVPTSSSDTTAVDSSTVPDTPVDTTPPPPPIVVAAAGDMSCPLADPVTPTKGQAAAVSDAMLREPDLSQLFALGDLQYVAGSLQDFTASYELTYDRLKDITRPAVGNPEHMKKEATGYFTASARGGTPARAGTASTWVDLARRRPQLQLRPGRVRRREPAGAVAPVRPRGIDPPVHDRVLAPPAVLLR
jgi:hypothetical protein